ncbi:Uncharacterized protein PECH_004778 [Penicillium ucsense]|uniref:Uncharacterized protein n=1 Tax=Penicillium ucsense TaxID=2839758 RepID=A0A8J8WLW4_9EURO|nr:Uncharacterized protein PECM_007586 [Penicillium ucsense]KAF7739301.1 Uncharacterized protein PECH_004778 [Penicillium ucsense]
MALPYCSPSPKVGRFQQAMESVYGDFCDIKSPKDWTPPPASGGHRGRYLWTDAFGVINLLTMHKEYNRTGGVHMQDDQYLTLARRLIETVHQVLGRTRDGRSPLPGATEHNPLGGGLRIGKTDEDGPDCDGQYHHYLTIWMFALNRMAVASGNMHYNDQAIQLARAIHPRFFVDRKTARPRMVWKMSMDLSRPLVSSEGNLDPIDGFVIFRLLQATAATTGDAHVLDEEIADYRRVMDRKGQHFVSKDPLDLGMTLWTAHWFAETEKWASSLVARCFEQLYDLFEIQRYLERGIRSRLAFREFGTSLGLQCESEQSGDRERATDFKNWADAIIVAWDPYMELSAPAAVTPADLRPITRVMYASALIPGAFCSGYFGPESTLKKGSGVV